MSNTEASRKKAKRFAVIIGILFVVLIVLNALLDSSIFNKLFGKDEDVKKARREVFLYEPDYDEDIFENEEYLGLDRYITYTDGAMSVRAVTKEDLRGIGKYAVMFGQYFDTVINGDADEFNRFFTKEYIEKNGKKDRFTMQMIYGIDIRKLNEYTENENSADEYTVIEFEVRYAIHCNNGTFRDDLESDVTRPQIYEVIEAASDGSMKINSISDYKMN